jgi:transcriptional regulator with XRE-family HTH domain
MIGANLKQARERKGITQEALARELGVSWVTVSRYERNAYPPSISRLQVIAAILDVQVADLLEEAA